MAKNNIITLSKYLLTKGVDSALKLQKILFFLRVEELKNKATKDSYFKDNQNFQAWIYGPVSYESYTFMYDYFAKLDETESFILSDEEVKEIDKKYGKYLDKYIDKTPNELVELSHKNKAWIKARKGYAKDAVCKEYMDENESFIEFNQ